MFLGHAVIFVCAVALGVFVSFLVNFLFALPLQNFHAPPQSGEFEFTPSKGSALGDAALALLSLTGAIVILASRKFWQIDPYARTFVIGIIGGFLGLAVLCQLFSLPSLFDSRF